MGGSGASLKPIITVLAPVSRLTPVAWFSTLPPSRPRINMELPLQTSMAAKSRWRLVVSLALSAFAGLALFTQLFDEEEPRRYGG